MSFVARKTEYSKHSFHETTDDRQEGFPFSWHDYGRYENNLCLDLKQKSIECGRINLQWFYYLPLTDNRAKQFRIPQFLS